MKFDFNRMTSVKYRIIKKPDRLILFFLSVIIIGLPLAIGAYDRSLGLHKVPQGAKEFTLTGHAQRGWVQGNVRAFDVLAMWRQKGPAKRPVLKVKKGDQVVLKLKSSDVVHGFSLKDFGVFVNEGIQPGKVVWVSFKANTAGTYTFSCNAVCGDNHQNMQGTLVVVA